MDTFLLGDIEIAVTRKDVKNVHLTVHPPEGRVTLVAPTNSRLEVLRAYAITRLGWIRKLCSPPSPRPAGPAPADLLELRHAAIF